MKNTASAALAPTGSPLADNRKNASSVLARLTAILHKLHRSKQPVTRTGNARPTKKRITLALQGGGSHGAFTWGVLDRLLEDERIDIEGISGASAGAINAAVLAHGYTLDGNAGARLALNTFWKAVATKNLTHLATRPTGMPTAGSNPAIDTFAFLSRFFSPYQLNPFNLNPLRDLLAEQIDFERLRQKCSIKLFVAATRVSTGLPRIFSTAEIDLDALLASTCLPSLHHPVEIDKEVYWDGGFTANPPLHPLIYECSAHDLLLVTLQPRRRAQTPTTAEEISQRLTEISFNAALSAELQSITRAKWEAERALFSFGRLDRRLRRLHLHRIGSHDFMNHLSLLSKFNTESAFIEALRKKGRSHASTWLNKIFSLLGTRSSLALSA
jgi:NTE family protein